MKLMRYVLTVILITGLMAACGDPQVIVIEREVVVATPTPGPTPTSTPISTPVPAPTETPTIVPTAKLLSPTEIIERSRSYVVRISPATGCASGVMLGRDGLILTNHHVVDGKEGLFATTDNGTVAPLRVLVSDPSRDLALVQAMTTLPEPEPLVWGNITGLGLGTELFVLGYPLCSDSITVTRGIFSGRTRIRGQPLLQTDAALNPGVSGGLAVTANGTAIGIAVGGFTERENVGFLIPASEIEPQAQQWLTQLAAGRLEQSSTSQSLSPTATPRPRPTATPQPRPTSTPRPRPTATPQPRPTATPQPTATPTPVSTTDIPAPVPESYLGLGPYLVDSHRIHDLYADWEQYGNGQKPYVKFTVTNESAPASDDPPPGLFLRCRGGSLGNYRDFGWWDSWSEVDSGSGESSRRGPRALELGNSKDVLLSCSSADFLVGGFLNDPVLFDVEMSLYWGPPPSDSSRWLDREFKLLATFQVPQVRHQILGWAGQCRPGACLNN